MRINSYQRSKYNSLTKLAFSRLLDLIAGSCGSLFLFHLVLILPLLDLYWFIGLLFQQVVVFERFSYGLVSSISALPLPSWPRNGGGSEIDDWGRFELGELCVGVIGIKESVFMLLLSELYSRKGGDIVLVDFLFLRLAHNVIEVTSF
jgi:hypothetical protein